MKVAAIQMTSGADWQVNCLAMQNFVQQAAQAGAELVVLPENFAFIGAHDSDKLALAEDYGNGPIQEALATAAKTHQISIVGGTIPLRTNDAKRVTASSLVFSASGECVARYDKIHLFDVEVGTEEKVKKPIVNQTLSQLATPSSVYSLGKQHWVCQCVMTYVFLSYIDSL